MVTKGKSYELVDEIINEIDLCMTEEFFFKFAVTSHHFVEPLALAVSDLG